jgi:hypothetical protein
LGQDFKKNNAIGCKMGKPYYIYPLFAYETEHDKLYYSCPRTARFCPAIGK